MRKFLKDNLFLVLGVSLPLMLVGVFAVSKIVPAMTVADPQYSFIFEAQNYSHGSKRDIMIEFVVQDERIVPRYKKSGDKNYYNNRSLYRYDHQTNAIRKIDYPTPDIADLEDDKWKEFKIAELENLKISKDIAAPDGYKFYNDRYRNRGLFYSGGSRRIVGMKKDSRLVKSEDLNNSRNNYYDAQFVGWIINK